VSTPTPPSNQSETPRGRECLRPAITGGEVLVLWWFIHGNIMTPETWNALLQAYGLCERHGWVDLSVAMSFCKRHFLGTIPYRALVEKSVQAIEACQRIALCSPVRLLWGAAPCFLRASSVSNAGAGAALPTRLDRSRDTSGLRFFTTDSVALWRSKVCIVCMGRGMRPMQTAFSRWLEILQAG
jgi:hypothetical protein